MEQRPVNLAKLKARHQIKFIHGRSFQDLENDVNRFLAGQIGEIEIREIKLDLSQT